MKTMQRTFRQGFLGLGLALVLGTGALHASQASDPHGAQGTPTAHGTPAEQVPQRSAPWSKNVLDLAARMPIQEGGRVKPLSTYAAFTLLRLNGKRSVETPTGDKLTPTAWLLDVLYDPSAASRYEMFLVQDSAVIDALGLTIADKKRRDRYSFAELEPGFDRLMSLAHEYDRIESKRRTSLQQQVVNLGENLLAFVRINRHELLAVIPPWGEDATRIAGEEWWTPPELAAAAVSKPDFDATALRLLKHFESLGDLRDDPAGFERELGQLVAGTTELAHRRGEGGKIDSEVSYYRAKPITWSLVCFLIAFLLACGLWLKPKSVWLYRACAGLTLAGTLLLTAAITWRCLIRSRPPVSTLYETVLFVTCVGAFVALVSEWIQKNRVAISAAAVLGTVGLFIANGYETLDKQDTMPSLVAVLDTNFWLATHVTSITVGYAGGMLAALLGSIYLGAKVLGLKRENPAFYRTLSRTVYGVLCFAVIFSTVGTILGGIWANDSWGRFWGWDPKENGALLIVISQLVILHARMGGYLREHGVCMAAAFGGTVVAFSWWGVNLLGVGLHSYGFTSGISKVLWTYYGLQWGVVALGAWAWLRERGRLKAQAGVPVDAPRSALPSKGRASTGEAQPVTTSA